jgi:hypothetical protein
MKNKIKLLLSKKGFSFVWTTVIMIILLSLSATIFEVYRLNTISSAVREKFQQVMISEAADNYRNMLNTTRDGFAGSQSGNSESRSFSGITTKNRIVSSLNEYLNNGEKTQIVVRTVDFDVSIPQTADERWYEVSGVVTVDVPGIFMIGNDSVMALKIKVFARWRGEF